MIDQSIKYLVPASIEEAVNFRSQFGESARFIAGGTEVVPKITCGRLEPTCLIELSRIEQLLKIERHERYLHVGAAVTLADLQQSPLIIEHWPALAEAAASIKQPQVRNLGTIGGNISHDVPCADLAPPLLVFDAMVGLVGLNGRRWVSLEEFLIGPHKTTLQSDELVAEFKLPKPECILGSAFKKLTKYSGSGLSIATVAVALSTEDDRIVDARLAIGSAGPVPRRITAAEAFLVGKYPNAEVLSHAGELASQAADPREDSIRASPTHRRRVLKPLATRTIAVAAERAGNQTTGANQ
ncbi:MAG: FAD binding domain-containing protein [Methyloligellaceae bacterium]